MVPEHATVPLSLMLVRARNGPRIPAVGLHFTKTKRIRSVTFRRDGRALAGRSGTATRYHSAMRKLVLNTVIRDQVPR